METVDGLGKNSRAGCLTYASGTAKQVGMSQLTRADGILQGGGQCTLSDHRIERGGAVLSGRNDIVVHVWLVSGVYVCLQR